MAAHSRRKRADGEREIVALARAAGLAAQRTWHLAQSPSERERCCDVRIAGRAYQVKQSRDGFGALCDGLRDVAGLFVRADGHGWLVVLRAEDYLRALTASNRGDGILNGLRHTCGRIGSLAQQCMGALRMIGDYRSLQTK